MLDANKNRTHWRGCFAPIHRAVKPALPFFAAAQGV